MANALDKARQALATARDKITEWDRALETARRGRDEARQAAPADPTELERYADEYARAEGRIRAAEQGKRVAEARVVETLEGVVRAGLEDATAELRAARKAHSDHQRKLDALLSKVSELDGADYRAVILDDLDNGMGIVPGMSVKASRAARLQGEVWACEKLVKRMSQALETGDLPAGELGEVPPYVGEYLRARRAAGIPTAAEAAQAAAIEAERLSGQVLA